ncbi:hypothetical protein CIB95_00870 [Lottiidibacillus patelloidae]|uniref:Cell wall-active antibiotics response LiaF-like C-terminal domain-containing protein n=1 Tax=Lottiidibacillus patelloidae TaxID=2670334 RepID=A0A263BX72_9BACI|nr:cell wall-active antibiotics response protein LiaF [Lottiidibacillus patelloidae]OZM58162.1 hypothetical protein CIB95_00870 [Lottiidibacillus patelloidae]
MKFSNFITALMFVSLGTVLLLINLEVISLTFSQVIAFGIPIILVLIGLKGIVNIVFYKRNKSIFWSLFLITIGLLLFMDELQMLSFELATLWKLWPIILIYIGLKVLTRKHVKSKNHEKNSGNIKVVLNDKGKSPVGTVSYKDPNWQVEPMNQWKAVGDFTFDFTKAFIPETETDIQLSGWVGDVDILLPEDVEFSIEAYAKVGDIKVCGTKEDGLLKDYRYKTAGFDTATKRLRFVFDFKVLDLRIDQI